MEKLTIIRIHLSHGVNVQNFKVILSFIPTHTRDSNTFTNIIQIQSDFHTSKYLKLNTEIDHSRYHYDENTTLQQI
jgi:hypothetical protein